MQDQAVSSFTGFRSSCELISLTGPLSFQSFEQECSTHGLVTSPRPTRLLLVFLCSVSDRSRHLTGGSLILVKDVFNLDDKDATRCRNPKDKSWALRESDGKEQALKTRHALRYIFPRQHGLSNPFQVTSAAETFEYRNYADREDEIRVRWSLNSFTIFLSDERG